MALPLAPDAPTPPRPSAAVRVLAVDGHPALRAGLHELLRGEAGIECVGVLPGRDGLLQTVGELRPDVVVLDYALGRADGLRTCFAIKQQPGCPAVVLYSAYDDEVFAVPAAIAQADATVAKSAPVGELLATIRRAAAGELPAPLLDREAVEAASARLLAEDLPVAVMLLGATPVAEIADVLDLPPAEIRSRALRIIGRLQARARRPQEPRP